MEWHKKGVLMDWILVVFNWRESKWSMLGNSYVTEGAVN